MSKNHLLQRSLPSLALHRCVSVGLASIYSLQGLQDISHFPLYLWFWLMRLNVYHICGGRATCEGASSWLSEY